MEYKKAGYLEGIVSILLNTILFILKLWAGTVSGSIALTADAWHTLSDSISSIIVILGVKLSSRKADEEHPFGHGRWEQISAIFIGFLLLIIAYDFLKDSISQFQLEKTANFGMLAIIVTIISIIVKELLAQYAFYLSRKTNSLSIKADAWHHRTDAISSVVVLVGIFFTDKFWWIDSVLGVIIACMLFYVAYQIIKDTINKILGERPSKELISDIETLIKEIHHENLHPHHYHIHNYITNKALTFHIKFDNETDIFTAHYIATEIEQNIKSKLNIISTIHIEPNDFEHDND